MKVASFQWIYCCFLVLNFFTVSERTNAGGLISCPMFGSCPIPCHMVANTDGCPTCICQIAPATTTQSSSSIEETNEIDLPTDPTMDVCKWQLSHFSFSFLHILQFSRRFFNFINFTLKGSLRFTFGLSRFHDTIDLSCLL